MTHDAAADQGTMAKFVDAARLNDEVHMACIPASSQVQMERIRTRHGRPGRHWAMAAGDDADDGRIYAFEQGPGESGGGRMQDVYAASALVCRGTLLHLAALAGDTALVEALLRLGADACALAHVLWHAPGLFPSAVTDLTAAGAAALGGHAATAELLCRSGGPAGGTLAGLCRAGPGPPRGLGVSHVAAKCARGAAFDRLAGLFRPGDPNAKDGALLGPLHWACSDRRGVDNIAKLVAMEAWVDAVDADGSTPVYYLAGLGADDRESVEKGLAALLCAGARVDHVNRRGLSPLGHAAAELRTHLMEFLLEIGADPDGGTGAGPDGLRRPDQRPAFALLRAHEQRSRCGHDEQRSAAAARGLELLLGHGSRVDGKQLVTQMLRSNVAAAPLLLRLWAGLAAPLELRELRELFLDVAAAPWRVNASLGFMLQHCLPGGRELDAWGLAYRLLASPAVRVPGFMRLAGPGFDANRRDGRGRTCLMVLLENAAYEHGACGHVLDDLLRRGADPSARTARGHGCLHSLVVHAAQGLRAGDHPRAAAAAAALTRSFSRTLAALARRGLDADADADAAGSGGGALHCLARMDAADALAGCARSLLAHGADAARVDDEGQTALDVYLKSHRWAHPTRSAFARVLQAYPQV